MDKEVAEAVRSPTLIAGSNCYRSHRVMGLIKVATTLNATPIGT